MRQHDAQRCPLCNDNGTVIVSVIPRSPLDADYIETYCDALGCQAAADKRREDRED